MQSVSVQTPSPTASVGTHLAPVGQSCTHGLQGSQTVTGPAQGPPSGAAMKSLTSGGPVLELVPETDVVDVAPTSPSTVVEPLAALVPGP